MGSTLVWRHSSDLTLVWRFLPRERRSGGIRPRERKSRGTPPRGHQSRRQMGNAKTRPPSIGFGNGPLLCSAKNVKRVQQVRHARISRKPRTIWSLPTSCVGRFPKEGVSAISRMHVPFYSFYYIEDGASRTIGRVVAKSCGQSFSA